METERGQNGDRTGTERRQNGDKKVSMAFLTKARQRSLLIYGFHAILHDDVHEKLTAFSSMPCCCIFKNEFFYYDTEDAGHYPTVLLVAKWTFFRILLEDPEECPCEPADHSYVEFSARFIICGASE